MSQLIVQTAAGQDGWQHSGTTHFQMFGVRLARNGTGGIALNLNVSGNASNLTLRDVVITANGNQTTNYWHDGIKLIGCGLIYMDNVNVVGINSGDLSLVGNGLYISPRKLPTPAGCFVTAITNSTFNYWQNAICLDSAGAALNVNIQGIVLDWVNSVGCMQFVRVANPDPNAVSPPRSNILELVLHKCQAACYGSAIYAQNGFSVWSVTVTSLVTRLMRLVPS